MVRSCILNLCISKIKAGLKPNVKRRKYQFFQTVTSEAAGLSPVTPAILPKISNVDAGLALKGSLTMHYGLLMKKVTSLFTCGVVIARVGPSVSVARAIKAARLA